MSGKVLIITGTLGHSSWKPLNELTEATKLAYAERWGGDLLIPMRDQESWDLSLCGDDGKKKWNSIGFARIRACQLALRQLLEGYFARDDFEFLLWMDADSCIVRQEENIVDHLNAQDPSALFYACDDGNGLQSGIFAFRVCAASLDILNRVWESDPSWNTENWLEQGCLAFHTREPGVRAYCEKRFLNAYPFSDYEKGYSWGVHCPSRSDEERYESLKRCIDEGATHGTD